jgi:hypothetical protein
MPHSSERFFADVFYRTVFIAGNVDNQRLRPWRKKTMADRARAGSIFIRDGTILPPSLSVTTDAFLPNWRIVTSHDRSALAHSIEGSDWYFFYLAGDIQATVLGRSTRRALRKAVIAILTKRADDKFNSFEITAIVSKRFLGIPFTTFTAHARQIQRRIALIPEAKFVPSAPATPVVGEAAVKRQPALASSS